MGKNIFRGIVFVLLTLMLPFLLTKLLTNKNQVKHLPNVNDVLIYSETTKNMLSLEDYITGVVLASIPITYESETLKAQAVIARTYALKNIMILNAKRQSATIDALSPQGTSFSTSQLGFEYADASTYMKYMDAETYTTYVEHVKKAVKDTAGEVILYRNELITPLFFSTSSGKTRDAEDLFLTKIPYLKSVDSNQDIESPSYMKISIYTIEQVLDSLNQAYKAKTLGVADYDYQVYDTLPVEHSDFFDTVTILTRDHAGYVMDVSLGGIKVSGDSFANTLGLSSSCFYIENYEDSVRFICSGSGHGIGFSQYGANVLAKRDHLSYKELLSYYYTNVEIEKIK